MHWRCRFAEFFPVILRRKSPPKQSAEQNHVEQEACRAEQKSCGLKLCHSRDRASRKRGWKPRKVGKSIQNYRARCRAVTVQQRGDEIQRNHRENEEREKQLPRPPPGQQPFQPGTDESLQRHVEQRKHANNQQHRGQHARLCDAGPDAHGEQPAQRCDRGEISDPIRQADDVERAEAQRETQQRSKLEIRSKTRDEDRKNLQEKKNAPEKQCHPARAAARNKGVRSSIERKAQSEDQIAAQDSGQDQPDQIEPVIFLAQAVSENSPAKSRNEPDLLEDAGGFCYISHESSSSCGRSVPS